MLLSLYVNASFRVITVLTPDVVYNIANLLMARTDQSTA